MTKFTKFAVAAAFAFFAAAITASAYITVPPNVSMTSGSTEQVMAVQTAVGVTADGKFGPATKAAVVSFQSTHGLTADGVVGAMTASALNAMGTTTGTYPAGCTSSTGFSTTTGMPCTTVTAPVVEGCAAGAMFSSITGEACDGEDTDGGDDNNSADFDGTEGSVDSFELTSADQSDISEGQEEVELIAVDIELDSDGDLLMDRADFYFEMDSTVTASSKPWDYFSKAYLMVEGEVIADMDVDSSSDWDDQDVTTADDMLDVAEGTTNDEYKLRFSDLDTMLSADETTTISVGFDAVDGIDSDDEDAVWFYGIESDSFRFEDGTGFVFTDGDNEEDTFDLDVEETADVEITTSTNDPEATVIEVDESSDTMEVLIGAFEVEETQDVDVTITEMEVTLVTSDTVADVYKKAYLFNGSDMIGEESVPTSGIVVFDNLEFEIAGDDTEEVSVKVDLDDTDDGVRYSDGTTIQVTDVEITELEDEFGNDEGDVAGLAAETFASQTHSLRAEGIGAEFEDGSATLTLINDNDPVGEDDKAKFEIEFTVTAFGDDMYIDKSIVLSNAGVVPTTAGQGVVVGFRDTDNAAVTPAAGTLIFQSSSTETEDSSASFGNNNAFFIAKGESRTFTAKYENVVLGADGTAEMYLRSINFIAENDATLPVDAAESSSFYTFDLNNFKTGVIAMDTN